MVQGERPRTRHEGALVGLLSALEPGRVPDVVAVDPERGWSLTHDAGPVMRLARHADEVLGTGLLEVSPVTRPEQLRALVAEPVATHRAEDLPVRAWLLELLEE